MYAIMNTRTKKYVKGIDYRRGCQITSDCAMLTFETAGEAEHELILRKCGKSYEVVRIRFVRASLYKEDKAQIEKVKRKWDEVMNDEDD